MVVSACLYAEYHGDSCSHSWYDLDSDAGVGLVWFASGAGKSVQQSM